MMNVILRSICVGIASMVVAMGLVIFAELAFAMHWAAKNFPSGGSGGEVGIDLVTMVHNGPTIGMLLPLLAFPIGFYFGCRYFSKSAVRKEDGTESRFMRNH
jgi:hypothetical protein